ncbi:MAG: DNA polymerase III subunit gamma/tau [Candidatus Wallbacteria bacterium]|nr:DNA polymerase III subunit gamma/tau [Candidatus Wallbacteria bacterium]
MSLYQKYRPRKFSELVGQNHVTGVLKNSLKTGKLTHAYLFCGPRGSGKTSTARILTKAINCLSPIDFEPCLSCSNCRSIEQGTFVDLFEIDAASNRKVEDIRDLREKVIFAPQCGKYKVYIIDEAHMLTREAFNAFLKMLEEPPSHTIFILATTEPEKLLPTIISRCQRHNFRRASLPEIAGHLEKIWLLEKSERGLGEIESSAFMTIARLSDGALRDSLCLLEQLTLLPKDKITSPDLDLLFGLLPSETCQMIVELLSKKNYPDLDNLVNRVLDGGTSVNFLIQELITHLKEKILSAEADSQLLVYLLENLIWSLEKLRWHPFPRQVLDLVFMKTLFQGGYSREQRASPEPALRRSSETTIIKPPAQPVSPPTPSVLEDKKIDTLIFQLSNSHPGLAAILRNAKVKLWSPEKLSLSFFTPFEFKFASLQDQKKIILEVLSKHFNEKPDLDISLDKPASRADNLPPQVKKLQEMFGAEIIDIINN